MPAKRPPAAEAVRRGAGRDTASRDAVPSSDRGGNARRTAPGNVRIVGGQWKRTPLPVPDVDGLRPTPDRIRETLFNWLGQQLDGLTCLDPFAGSGVLGLEAASRGASSVLLIERDRQAGAAIRGVISKLDARQVSLVIGDSLRVLAGLPHANRFDVVFLDPPFHQGWLPRILPLIAPLLSEDARLYVEHEQSVSAEQMSAGLTVGNAPAPVVETLHANKAGQVHYHLFRLKLP